MKVKVLMCWRGLTSDLSSDAVFVFDWLTLFTGFLSIHCV